MNILDKIVKTKELNLPSSLEVTNESMCKPFLKKGRFSIIAEIKRGSPSLGLIKPNLDVERQSRIYEKNGASAISVLTEEDYFFGSIQDLKIVKNIVDLPILRKDFIFTKEQLVESKNIGADAVLLIVSVLKDETVIRQLLSECAFLGLSAVVETHNKSEIETAINAGASIVGINNRDLKTFKTDINVSLELKQYIPDDIIAVSESGIGSIEDVFKLKDAGFDAVLIGEAFIKNQSLVEDFT